MIRSPTSKVGNMDLEEMYRSSATNHLSKVAAILDDLPLLDAKDGGDDDENDEEIATLPCDPS
jgi:hypothetical protein